MIPNKNVPIPSSAQLTAYSLGVVLLSAVALVQIELQVHCCVMLILLYAHRLQASSKAVLACGGSCVSLLLTLKVVFYLLLAYSWLKTTSLSGIW